MSAPRPSSPGAQSEEELLEQWAFLDRLVEHQASLLRAGVQDSEEVDDPAGAPSDVQQLERQLERARSDVATADEARREAERRVAELVHRTTELERRLSGVAAELQRAQHARADALTALRSAHLEVESLRQRLERERRRFWPFRRS